MLRGEVWWVNFDPSLGGEIQKTRPAVIVSNNASNRVLNRLQVLPITSQVGGARNATSGPSKITLPSPKDASAIDVPPLRHNRFFTNINA